MKKNNNKPVKDKRTSNFEKKQVEKNDGEKIVVFKGSKSVQDLAKDLGVSATEVIKFLFMEGKMVTINSDLDVSLAELVCLNYGYDIKIEKDVSEENFEEVKASAFSLLPPCAFTLKITNSLRPSAAVIVSNHALL